MLRECVLDAGVESVVSVVRSASNPGHPKVREIVCQDIAHLAPVENELQGHDLQGYDACFFCLGVSSAGMSASEYRRITYDLTIAAATTMARLNPAMPFV